MSVGRIDLIIGPMFSGKTTELLRRIERNSLATHPVTIIKYIKDVRYGDDESIVTHSQKRQNSTEPSDTNARVTVVAVQSLSEVEHTESVIGIDEGQFYPDLIEFCNKWANEGKQIIIAALDGDFARRPFGRVCDLIPLCDSVTKLQGICMMCKKNDSSFTKRINKSDVIIEIGSKESYLTVCRNCYQKL